MDGTLSGGRNARALEAPKWSAADGVGWASMITPLLECDLPIAQDARVGLAVGWLARPIITTCREAQPDPSRTSGCLSVTQEVLCAKASAEPRSVCYSACEIWCQRDPAKIHCNMGEDQGQDVLAPQVHGRPDAAGDDVVAAGVHSHIGTWPKPRAPTETMLANRHEPVRSDRRAIA